MAKRDAGCAVASVIYSLCNRLSAEAPMERKGGVFWMYDDYRWFNHWFICTDLYIYIYIHTIVIDAMPFPFVSHFLCEPASFHRQALVRSFAQGRVQLGTLLQLRRHREIWKLAGQWCKPNQWGLAIALLRYQRSSSFRAGFRWVLALPKCNPMQSRRRQS